MIIGAGKVGRALAQGLGIEARSYRAGLPNEQLTAPLIVLAVRDGDIVACAAGLDVAPGCAVVHCAGALGPEVLAPLAAGKPLFSVQRPSFHA